MRDVILKVENLSKQYRLGTVGTRTITHDFNRFLAKLRGKEDPYLKIGESNDRTSKGYSDYVWALKNINFEVKKGEVLGIIGKNGAGKSTLLKILSKITAPTTGTIKSKGRIASLLEVGTGFHSEMTGKENIFLNGAILGMTKKEIESKLEEIISFSGCERYIDTPVKRYSSGMTVRLAFAVAAFLEPDILVIDEVLAVGDAEFQKKAIGKMQDIATGEGRTVLFVSHNMAAVKNLCNRCIVLENGTVAFEGSTEESINYYLANNFEKNDLLKGSESRKGSGQVRIIDAFFTNKSGKVVRNLISGEEATLSIKYTKKTKDAIEDIFLGLTFYDNMGAKKTVIASDELGVKISLVENEGVIKLELPSLLFREGTYNITFYLAKFYKNSNDKEIIDFIENGISFQVERSDFWKTGVINRPDGFLQDAIISIN